MHYKVAHRLNQESSGSTPKDELRQSVAVLTMLVFRTVSIGASCMNTNTGNRTGTVGTNNVRASAVGTNVVSTGTNCMKMLVLVLTLLLPVLKVLWVLGSVPMVPVPIPTPCYRCRQRSLLVLTPTPLALTSMTLP